MEVSIISFFVVGVGIQPLSVSKKLIHFASCSLPDSLFILTSGRLSTLRHDDLRTLLAKHQQHLTGWQRVLMGMLGDQFVQRRGEEFRQRLRDKVRESVSQFKGSWDVDQYCEEASIRGKLAYQLRHQHHQYDKEVRDREVDLFPVINSTFFSETRPIFFEEKAVKEGY